MGQRARRAARAGFTLIELLIVLIILVLVLAFVVPDIIERVDDAEPVRVANDLRSITEGIEIFVLDTRNSYPGDLEDLVHRPTIGTDKTGEGNHYRQQHSARWDGPYLRKALAVTGVATDSDDQLQTGYSGFVLNPLLLWEATATNTENQTTPPTACADEVYLTVQVSGLSEDEFLRVNEAIDRADESDPVEDGNLRWISDGADADTGELSAAGTTYYLAVPCRGFP